MLRRASSRGVPTGVLTHTLTPSAARRARIVDEVARRVHERHDAPAVAAAHQADAVEARQQVGDLEAALLDGSAITSSPICIA